MVKVPHRKKANVSFLKEGFGKLIRQLLLLEQVGSLSVQVRVEDPKLGVIPLDLSIGQDTCTVVTVLTGTEVISVKVFAFAPEDQKVGMLREMVEVDDFGTRIVLSVKKVVVSFEGVSIREEVGLDHIVRADETSRLVRVTRIGGSIGIVLVYLAI